MSYTYEYPRPSVTVDLVIFTIADNDLKVLLIRRGGEPFKGRWALPGGSVEIGESLEKAAARELKEEAGVTWNSFTPSANRNAIRAGASSACRTLRWLTPTSSGFAQLRTRQKPNGSRCSTQNLGPSWRSITNRFWITRCGGCGTRSNGLR